MHLEVPPDLADRLNLREATRLEREDPRASLPSRVVEHALENHEDDYAEAMRARVRKGIEIARGDTIWMPKPGHVGRYRPITVLAGDARVLMRALTLDIAEAADPPERTVEAQETFQRAPLEGNHPYIVVADVASFYFYVDHEYLEDRIVEEAGRADTALAIRTVLAGLVERSYGLPQNFGPSSVLSELVISPVQRRLLRQGIATYRHNDDFRLGTDTWGTALEALENLQAAVSAVGLDLNGEKSWLLKRETYERNLTLAGRLLDEAFEAVGGRSADFEIEFDHYTGEPLNEEPPDEEPPDDETLEATITHAFERAVEQRLDGASLNGFELRANRQLMLTALGYMGSTRSTAALTRGPAIVAIDPLMASSYAAYLRRLSPGDEGTETSDRVLRVLEAFEGHAPHWTEAWLMETLRAPFIELSTEVEDWLRLYLRGPAPDILRARAALVLGIHHKLRGAELTAIFEVMSEAARPDIVAALAYALAGDETTREARSVIEAGHLYRWVFEYASQHLDDPSWT